MMKRIFLIVLDSFGIGAAPDAADFGDENTNTLASVAKSGKFSCPNLRKLGLFNISGVACGEPVGMPAGSYGRLREKSRGKDTIIGHWELAGIISDHAMPVFPDGFPAEFVEEFERTNKKELKIEDVMYQKEFVEFGDVVYTEKTRAVIKVQDGCDRFCSYCIIPYARGRVRSRKPEKIIEEVKDIAKEGIKEIVITGIHIASYGKDFKDEYKLIDLLEELNKIKGIERIRLGSLEPLLITEQFVERLKKLDKICHHFHLSLQSGCDETLKRMNRRYTTEQFKDIVDILRKNYEDVNLTTDIIVGFPQETEEEFEKTYQFLKEIKFYKMHIFKYSQRKGTKAAVMEGQIDGSIKEKRSQKLIKLSEKNEEEYNKKYIGKTVEVLWEEEKNGYYQGHTKNYIQAHCKKESNMKDEEIENKIIKAKCKEIRKDYIVVDI